MVDNKKAAPRRKKARFKEEDLVEAVVDGTWTVGVGDDVFVSRSVSGRRQDSICCVKEIQGDIINTWDTTLEKWFCFRVKELEGSGVVVKAFKKS